MIYALSSEDVCVRLESVVNEWLIDFVSLGAKQLQIFTPRLTHVRNLTGSGSPVWLPHLRRPVRLF
jgi:hypothetical protein